MNLLFAKHVVFVVFSNFVEINLTFIEAEMHKIELFSSNFENEVMHGNEFIICKECCFLDIRQVHKHQFKGEAPLFMYKCTKSIMY